MHHTNNSIYVPANIVEKHRTESVLLLELHSPESADLPHFAVPYRRRAAEIRPYFGWRIYVSLDIRYSRVRASGPSYPLSKMGVFIDDLVRVEFHLEEAAVSLVSMGEQIDGHI